VPTGGGGKGTIFTNAKIGQVQRSGKGTKEEDLMDKEDEIYVAQNLNAGLRAGRAREKTSGRKKQLLPGEFAAVNLNKQISRYRRGGQGSHSRNYQENARRNGKTYSRFRPEA